MKIISSTKIVAKVSKERTEVGEAYLLTTTDQVHLRTQGGFTNLASGEYIGYQEARGDAIWVHLPNAELHLNN